VSDVDGATHVPKDGVEGSGSAFKDVAEVLFLCGAQLVLRSSILTMLFLKSWMLKFDKIFKLLL
jgi:hypothetical protein